MRDLAAQVRAAAQEMPIDRLIRRLNDASLSEEYRDKLAAIAAPYTAPRLSRQESRTRLRSPRSRLGHETPFLTPALGSRSRGELA